MSDPFDTATLRAAVLAGWAASDLRFREDANAEEALALGGYAGRALIELLCNGVDAAVSASVDARIRVSFDGAELRVANTGAPLSAAGVAGLATLRASAKRDERQTVGHFGVGFTAVRTVTDAPRIMSTSGGVGFDARATAEAVAELASGALDAEVAARAGVLPALRLPWPLDADEPGPPAGFVTEVRLPIRPEALAAVREQLAGAGEWLFFALPGLRALAIVDESGTRSWTRTDEGGTTTIGASRFAVVQVSGQLPAALLADRPVEERARTRWWLSWVRPLDGFAHGVLGAPVPTDERLTLPADLYGTFPVDDTRRRLAPGPATDFLLAAAGDAYVELVGVTPAGARWRLVPPDDFPAGMIDGTLRSFVLAALGSAPVLRTALDEPVAPGAAVLVSDLPEQAAPLLAQALPGLLRPPESAAADRALRRLGVQAVPLAQAVSTLSGLSRPPQFWWEVYETLRSAPTDALSGLPVPLVGGVLRPGPRGALLPHDVDGGLLDRVAQEVPTLPVVAPEAAHPLLARLGATAADAAVLAEHPALLARYAGFRADLDDDDPDPEELDALATLALDLVVAGGVAVPGVVLTDADDEPWPAEELLAPDAPFAAVLGADADLPQVHARWSQAYHQDVLAAVGVRVGLPVTSVAGQDLADLPDGADWPGVAADQVTVLADLDLIEDWAGFLALLAADRRAREAVADPDSYSSWWMRRFATLSGQPLGHFRRPGPGELVGLYHPVPLDLDEALLAGLGLPSSLSDAAADDADELLARYADPERTVPAVHVPAVTAAVVALLRGEPDRPLPDRVRTLAGTAVPAADALVLDAPWWAQVLDAADQVPGGDDPRAVADALELDLASRTGADPVPPGETTVERTASAALAVEPVSLQVRPGLTVRFRGRDTPVRWWSGANGLIADGSPQGVGRAVAWAAGRWDDRFLAIAALTGEWGV